MLLLITIVLMLSICGYRISIAFIDKHNSNQSYKAKLVTHKVYKVVWLVVYTGIVLLFLGMFSSFLLEHPNVYLNQVIYIMDRSYTNKIKLYTYIISILAGIILLIDKGTGNIFNPIKSGHKIYTSVISLILIISIVFIVMI